MPDLPQKKVGLIACSGEELACGTLSRVAVRLVLEELRPGQTVTLCLPLFLAGEKEERAFARFYPTIAVDGCDKWCARRATETYSAPVADAVRVDQELAQLGIDVRPSWRRDLDVRGLAGCPHAGPDDSDEGGRHSGAQSCDGRSPPGRRAMRS